MSKVIMTLCNSSGTYLKGCLQPQHYYVSLEITSPEDIVIARVKMSYEQAARMLLYSGHVECTLSHYLNKDGKIATEKVEKPQSVRERMEDRMGDVQCKLKDRIEDLRRDLDEIINGDKKATKKTIKDLYKQISTIQSHYASNESFVLQQAQAEVSEMQSSALGQLGLYLQTKTGVELSKDDLEPLLPVGARKSIPEAAKPVADSYEQKERAEKSVDDMTARQVAEGIQHVFDRISLSQDKNHRLLYFPTATTYAGRVMICYVSYQAKNHIDLDTAKRYLKFLQTIEDPKDFKTHWHFED